MTVTDEIELPRVYMLWLTPPAYEPGDADADMLAHVLGSGKSSRLYKKLVYDLQIAQDVDAARYPLKLGSVFYVQATCKPGVTPEKLEAAINQELAALRQDGPTRQEVEMARNSIQSALVFRLQRMGGVANLLNQYNQFLGDPGKFQWDLDRYDAANAATMKQFADSKLTDNSRVVLYAVKGKKVINDPPKGKEPQGGSNVAALNIPNQEWRKTAPAPGPLSKLNLPVPEQFTLSNGLTVLLTETHNLPVVAARVVALGGSGANPADKPGLAGFTARMLTEGTRDRSALKFADDLAQIGAQLESNSDADQSAVSTQVLKRNIGADFDLLSDVVLQPAFNEKEIERVRSQRATELLQINDDPQQLAFASPFTNSTATRATAIWSSAPMRPSRALAVPTSKGSGRRILCPPTARSSSPATSPNPKHAAWEKNISASGKARASARQSRRRRRIPRQTSISSTKPVRRRPCSSRRPSAWRVPLPTMPRWRFQTPFSAAFSPAAST